MAFSTASVLKLMWECVYTVPESPRYLVAQDRNEEALAMLAKYHGNGDENHPTVQFEYREIRETIKMEQAASK